jgi:hypothetical protein
MVRNATNSFIYEIGKVRKVIEYSNFSYDLLALFGTGENTNILFE